MEVPMKTKAELAKMTDRQILRIADRLRREACKLTERAYQLHKFMLKRWPA